MNIIELLFQILKANFEIFMCVKRSFSLYIGSSRSQTKFVSFTEQILKKECIRCHWDSTGIEKVDSVSVDFLTALVMIPSEAVQLTLSNFSTYTMSFSCVFFFNLCTFKVIHVFYFFVVVNMSYGKNLKHV